MKDFRKVAEELVKMLEKKNREYGDSYARTRNECGIDAFYVRLMDKANRLRTIVKSRIVNFDAYTDTIKDIAGYCILELAYLQEVDTTERILQALQGEGYPIDDDIKIGGTD